MNNHRVVVYNWVEGRLTFKEHILESLEHALAFIENLVCHDVKVYNQVGVLVASGSRVVIDTYA